MTSTNTRRLTALLLSSALLGVPGMSGAEQPNEARKHPVLASLQRFFCYDTAAPGGL